MATLIETGHYEGDILSDVMDTVRNLLSNRSRSDRFRVALDSQNQIVLQVNGEGAESQFCDIAITLQFNGVCEL